VLQFVDTSVHSAAERLAEQLGLSGIKKEVLSSRARLSLQLLASIASKLQLAEARPELVLAAWAALLVKESRAAAMLVSLAACIASLFYTYICLMLQGLFSSHGLASTSIAKQQSHRQLQLPYAPFVAAHYAHMLPPPAHCTRGCLLHNSTSCSKAWKV
jgi:hypothetical protein